MKDIIEHVPAIIEKASASPLGILALMIVALSLIGLFFFRHSSERTRIGIFVLMFIGVALFSFTALDQNPRRSSIEREKPPTRKDGYIKFIHQGGYVARFEVAWYERGKKKTWNSGDKTIGWTMTRRFPGDATRFSLKAIAYTGLAWQPENEILNVLSAGIPNRCYKVYGTTLNPAYGNCE